MGVVTKELKKGKKEVGRYILARAKEQHSSFANRIIRNAITLSPYRTGKYMSSWGSSGTAGARITVGPTVKYGGVIEYGLKSKGQEDARFVAGKAIGKSFEQIRRQGWKVKDLKTGR